MVYFLFGINRLGEREAKSRQEGRTLSSILRDGPAGHSFEIGWGGFGCLYGYVGKRFQRSMRTVDSKLITSLTERAGG